MRDKIKNALILYDDAKKFVISNGYSREVEWQRTRCFLDFTETDLLRETAWVILCCGFREAIVRSYFNWLSLCFCDWESAREIVNNASECRSTALAVFGNGRKIDAIVKVAQRVDDVGYSTLKKAICSNAITELQNLPFIGPVTSWHLAKNLGLEVAKPDRHLTRFSSLLGFDDANDLCRAVARVTGETISVVDIVFWRYAASGHHQQSLLRISSSAQASATCDAGMEA